MNAKVTTGEITELFTVDATSADKSYVTLHPNGVRITFVETIPNLDQMRARVAVTIPHSAMLNLHDALTQVIAMLERAKAVQQDIVENTEEKKEILQ